MTEVSQICHTRLEGQKLSAQDCYGHKQHALKGQKLSAQDCYGHKQHALKGQKPIAQGAALGYGLLPLQGVLGNFNRTGRYS